METCSRVAARSPASGRFPSSPRLITADVIPDAVRAQGTFRARRRDWAGRGLGFAREIASEGGPLLGAQADRSPWGIVSR